jgi:hypothetical protein
VVLGINSGRIPNLDKPEIANYKHQITNKIKRQLFGILDFGHCDLFGICDLLFGISITETRALAPYNLTFLTTYYQLTPDKSYCGT